MKILKIVLGCVIAIALGFAISQVYNKQTQIVGSVSQASEYHYTSGFGTSTGAAARSVVNVGTTILGSIVIASTTNSVFTIKDATSTIDTASTTVITIPAGAPAGTYTFDLILSRGLGIDRPASFFGEYLVTWR